MSQLCKYVQYANRSQNLLRLNMHRQYSVLKGYTENYPLRIAFSKIRWTWPFHVVVLQKAAKKCTKIQNVRAEPLWCSLTFCLVALSSPTRRRGLLKLRNIWEKRQGLLSQGILHKEYYLTIRLRARVFYKQIVNEAQPSWLSLIENEGE